MKTNLQSIEEFSRSWQGGCEGWDVLEYAVMCYFKRHHWRKWTLHRLVVAHSRVELAGAEYRIVEAEIVAYVKSMYNV